MAAVTSAKFASPEAYTPKHLAERIRTSQRAAQSERKLISVLFADMKASLELLADRDPEDARYLLDGVIERMMEAVHRYEGTVNQLMGDGIMALFGAPLSHEDHAVRACYAALRMHEAIAGWAAELRASRGIDIHIRVGINSGEVVVDSIRSDLSVEYVAIGQTTHLAARMEQLARPDHTLITADTFRLAEGYIEVEPVGPTVVKGLPGTLEIYELIGVTPTRSRLQVAVARGFTPFVGRRAQLEQMGEALERARAGQGQMVAVVGDAGIGKSRLIREFLSSPRLEGWRVLEARSVAYEATTAYLPVVELLQGYFQIDRRDDRHQIGDKVREKVRALGDEVATNLPALLALLGATEEEESKALDPRQRRARTLEAVRRLLVHESHLQPLVLVFEDLQWVDAGTYALLDSLVESLPTSPLLLLVNFRPEFRHEWREKAAYIEVRVDPLAPASAAELVDALLGREPSLRAVKRLLVERTEGNPFFLEESARALAEAGVLLGPRGGYRPGGAAETIRIPPTVQAVLAARIDRLAPEDKRLLQSAAVIGKDVPYALLEGVADMPEDALRRSLDQLQGAEFLYETSLFPDLEYTFRHALTHEVAYAGMLHGTRRALHARIAAKLEALAGDRAVEHLDRLAHHAFRGELWDKALIWQRQAGVRAMGRSASREAVACFEHALEALGHLPESRERIEQDIDLRCSLRHALVPLWEHERMVGHLRAAEALAHGLGDRRRLARVACFLTTAFWAMGDYARAVDAAGRALAIGDELEDVRVKVEASLQLGYVYHFMGDHRRAIDFLTKTIESVQTAMIDARLAVFFYVFSRVCLVWSLADLGEFGEAAARADEAMAMAEASRHPYNVVSTCFSNGHLHLKRGDLPRAIAALERGLTVCRSEQFSIWIASLTSWLGLAYALAGRTKDALPLLEEGVAAFKTTKIRASHALCLANLAEGHLADGRAEEALRIAQDAVHLARETDEHGVTAWVLRVVGDAAAQRDPPDVATAEVAFREAIAGAETIGMRPTLAHAHAGLGRLYHRLGRHAAAEADTAAAIELYRALDMPLFLQRAEALQAEIGAAAALL
jgi:class 3 adenylate cyclase/tetratricopeptide (TPR) repeat protein